MAMQEAGDFKAESDSLASLLQTADAAVFETVTQFKDWTIDDVIGHLHLWNVAAMATLESREAFQALIAGVTRQFREGKNHIEAQRVWLDETQNGIRGRDLFDAYRRFYPILASAYSDADPQARVAWAGPDMSTQSKIIARQMETWAHGQEIFDCLGQDRTEGDRIRNIAHLGVTTYGWTFRNRKEEPPSPKPYVRLTAPSGAIWDWNEPQDDNTVIGSAVEFAQIVTQTRNVADTSIKTIGDSALRWMAVAQCFAGAAETPPSKGQRHKGVLRA